MDVHEGIPRRKFLGGMGAVMAAIAAGGCAAAGGPGPLAAGRRSAMFAYVGCYTAKERNGRGEGVGVYRIDPASGAWTPVQLVKDVVNPSWLTLDHGGRFLYAAHGDGGEATAFAVDKESGRLTLLNRQPTNGKNGVRLAVDPTNRFAVLANYSTGTVAVLPINADGSLGPLSDLVTLSGKPGPHRTEQASAHPHDVVFDARGRFVVVPDKGLDATFVYRLDATSGKLAAATPPSVASRPGAGPRHVDFHPRKPYLYQINELDSTITTFRFDPDRGELKPLQVIATLPPAFTGNSTTSEIAVAPSGRFVYGSNRGHDSIAAFAVDEATGLLSPVGWEPTQGKTPRFFALDPSGAFLYAANQTSDTIVAFRADPGTGKLTPTGRVVKTGSPSSIVFR
jgi:6-phosphogluconolactonase (cycloisomerase 2 family)